MTIVLSVSAAGIPRGLHKFECINFSSQRWRAHVSQPKDL